MRFSKAHGTGNDFVVLPDPDGAIALTPELVKLLCDRRRGIGADGVLRVVRAAKDPDATHMASEAEWFMDYHNSDGSLAEMCGNGARVYARYLVSTGLVPADVTRLPIATRAGVVMAEIGPELITVDMVYPTIGSQSAAVLDGASYEGTSVDVGNPHLVCWTDDLAVLDLTKPPALDPEVFPEYGNVEFITSDEPIAGADAHVVMRVHERGSGETLSCGSGTCAVAAVALRDAGLTEGVVEIDVPGGRISVRIDDDGCHLTGPAVIVATGDIDLDALQRGL
jgi:diaminopimelate epimerase